VVEEERAGAIILRKSQNSGSRRENWSHYFRKKPE
jgi:hypothetical protein